MNYQQILDLALATTTMMTTTTATIITTTRNARTHNGVLFTHIKWLQSVFSIEFTEKIEKKVFYFVVPPKCGDTRKIAKKIFTLSKLIIIDRNEGILSARKKRCFANKVWEGGTYQVIIFSFIRISFLLNVYVGCVAGARRCTNVDGKSCTDEDWGEKEKNGSKYSKNKREGIVALNDLAAAASYGKTHASLRRDWILKEWTAVVMMLSVKRWGHFNKCMWGKIGVHRLFLFDFVYVCVRVRLQCRKSTTSENYECQHQANWWQNVVK